MTFEEFYDMAGVVVRLRKDLEAVERLATDRQRERDQARDELGPVALQLSAHVESLKLSNAQCAEYLRQNEQLQAAKDEMQNALAEATKDLAYSRLAVDTMCARDKRFTSTASLCGAGANEDLGDFIERTAAERHKLHSELVEVRAALAATTEQRDSLRRTLDEWSNADTKPHERVTAEDVADHVVLPILHVGEPDPVNDAKDAKLEFRNVVPTPEMIAACTWWDLVGAEKAICLKHNTLRTVAWRTAGDYDQDRWKYTDCPQPLKPHGMTWQQLDAVLASKKAAESTAAPVPAAELPLCNVCHECGSELINCSQGTNHHDCPRPLCPRTCTGRHGGGFSPYTGPCKSGTPVRHE